MSTILTNDNENSLNEKRYSRRKRGLDPEEIELIESPKQKKQKPYKMSNTELIEILNSIKEMKSELEAKIDTSQSAIETKINEITSTVNNEMQSLKGSFDDLKTKLSSDVESLKEQVAEHTQRLNNNEDDINRLKLSADLRLNGIPFSKDENLAQLFNTIAAEIGYDTTTNSNVPLLKRIPIRNKITGSMVESPIISLHFASPHHKQQFYSTYLSKMPLKAESIGLQKDLKIVIGESLTRTNAEIFKFAQKLKKENKIAQTFTADGLVKIKFVKGPKQRTHTVRNTTQLEILVKEYEQQLEQEKHKQQQQQQRHQSSASSSAMEIELLNSQRDKGNGMDTSIELLPAETQQNINSQLNGQIQQQLQATQTAITTHPT